MKVVKFNSVGIVRWMLEKPGDAGRIPVLPNMREGVLTVRNTVKLFLSSLFGSKTNNNNNNDK